MALHCTCATEGIAPNTWALLSCIFYKGPNNTLISLFLLQFVFLMTVLATLMSSDVRFLMTSILCEVHRVLAPTVVTVLTRSYPVLCIYRHVNVYPMRILRDRCLPVVARVPSITVTWLTFLKPLSYPANIGVDFYTARVCGDFNGLGFISPELPGIAV